MLPSSNSSCLKDVIENVHNTRLYSAHMNFVTCILISKISYLAQWFYISKETLGYPEVLNEVRVVTAIKHYPV